MTLQKQKVVSNISI